jgi:hypothetical protein
MLIGGVMTEEEDLKILQTNEVIISVKGGVAYIDQIPVGITVTIWDEDNRPETCQKAHYEEGRGIVYYEG